MRKPHLIYTTFLTVIMGAFALPAQAQITFEQVYTAPENAQLNLDYAKQEAEAGNLLQAASTLERLLYAEPNWDSARLFYSYVLIQLDDRQGATREIDLLNTRPLSTTQRNELSRYKGVLDANAAEPRPAAALRTRLQIGARYDDNGANTFTDFVSPTGNDSAVSAFARANLTAQKELTPGLSLIGGGSAYIRAPGDSGAKGISTFAGNVGLGGGEDIDWSARFGARLVRLDGDDFLSEIGPRGQLGFAINKRTRLNLGVAAVYQEYESLPGLPNEKFRSGQKYSLSAGLNYNSSEKTRLSASLGYEDKIATADIFAYDALSLSGNVHHSMTSDSYVRVNASYRRINYDGLNGFVTPAIKREDDHLYAQAAYGMRLSTIGSAFSSLDDVFLEGAFNAVDRSSNIGAFDYNNIGAELSLIWDF